MNKKIVIKMYGGLGNQLFQYAAGRYLSIKLGQRLSLDTSWFIHNKFSTKRQLDILDYPISFNEITNSHVFIFYIKLILKKMRKVRTNTSKSDLDIYLGSEQIVLDGYWQDIKIVNSIRRELLNEFRYEVKEKGELYEELKLSICNSNSVSLHIRRGDLTLKQNEVLKLNYYYDAIEIIRKTYTNPKFYIFSDDLIWCKENLEINHEHIFVDLDSPTMEIDLMSRCKSNILANSTFSWWGAWLNDHKDKKVIAPKEWFKRKLNQNLIDVQWILI